MDKGQDIPENLNFVPDLNNRKDREYLEQIKAYKEKRGI